MLNGYWFSGTTQNDRTVHETLVDKLGDVKIQFNSGTKIGDIFRFYSGTKIGASLYPRITRQQGGS